MARTLVQGSMKVTEITRLTPKPCPVDPGPFNFRDDFGLASGSLLGRTAVPGPGQWITTDVYTADGHGVIANGALVKHATDPYNNYDPAVGIEDNYIYSTGYFRQALEPSVPLDLKYFSIGFKFNETSLPFGDYAELMHFQGFKWYGSYKLSSNGLLVNYTEDGSAHGFDPRPYIGKEMIITLAVRDRLVLGDKGGSFKVCGVPIFEQGIYNGDGGFYPDPNADPDTETLLSGNTLLSYNPFGDTYFYLEGFAITFAPGLVVDYVWLKWTGESGA